MNCELCIQENSRRLRALESDFDPVRGIGCSGERIEVATPVEGLPRAFVPREMTDDPQYAVATGPEQWKTLRCRHDFEYWCVTCVRVKHKTLGTDVAFRLNRPQRRVAAVMEADRRAGRPIRLIMLKARQWGGSTLVQMYMAWIQSCHRRNWHSLICAHVKDTAAGIRGMYTKMLADYPEDLWEGDERPMFRPYERSLNVREITGRGCRVTVGSAENHEAVRGSDYAMAHLSETAFWPSTPQHTPEGLVRAVCGSIALMPYSLIVMESTANGIGNYFHSEWLRCRDGRGDKRAVFVPWYEIELYSVPVDDPEAVITSMSPYERSLWDMGLTLEQIYWYRLKSSEYLSHEMMMAEFPTTDTEAFAATGSGVFDPADVERLRGDCREPLMTADADSSGTLVEDPAGGLQIWEKPDDKAEYVAAVDVGGRSVKSDWSVIAVMRRGEGMRRHEIVAQWRGHLDHDRLAAKCAAVGRLYNDALLIVESNTLECEADGGTDSNLFILSRLAETYRHLYRRETLDGDGRASQRLGFHTNRATKAALVSGLIEAVRDGAYTERDTGACNELLTYEQRRNGSYGARAGFNDDIVMTRAMALHALRSRQTHLAGPAPVLPPKW